jgi:hypothetical protein
VVDNFGKAYVAGNFVEGNARVSNDNWDAGVQPDAKSNSIVKVLAQIRANSPFPHGPLSIESAEGVYATVLASAGATLPKRDEVDQRIIRSVRTGQVSAKAGADIQADLSHAGYSQQAVAELIRLIPLGIITHPSQVGGYPEYKGSPYKDSDGDGMPDEWEIKYGLNPNDPSDAAKDNDNDGYTNLEEFLNGTDPTKFVDYTKLTNNVDVLK